MLGKVVIVNGQKKIQALTADTGTGAPVGSIIVVCSNILPSGYLGLGVQYDITNYPALYQVLGTDTTPTASALGLPTLSSGQYAIKATSGLTENQQEDVLNTINENNSYSTEEHPTGAKWIDGKPIYRRSFICSGTFTGTANVWNDITTKFTDLSGLIANISSLISANLHNRFPNNDSPLHQLTLGEYILHYPSTNNISVYLLAGQTIREGAVLVVEYTKTTD